METRNQLKIMQNFVFQTRELVKVWENIRFSIQAETYEDAVQKLKDMKHKNIVDDKLSKDKIEIHYNLYDEVVGEKVAPSENNGKATLFYFEDNGVEICNNAEK